MTPRKPHDAGKRCENIVKYGAEDSHRDGIYACVQERGTWPRHRRDVDARH